VTAYESVDSYANALLGNEDPLLGSMRSEAAEEGLPAIQVPPEIGRLLTLLIKLRGARRVLEIGTLFGYSTVIMARALPGNGSLLSLEFEPKHAVIARRNLERAGVSARARVEQGDAAELLRRLSDETFDLVFIDADKASYPVYLQQSLRLTRSGSVIVADNVWRGGEVVDPQDDNARGAAEFNRMVADESRLLTVFISSRGGEDAASVSLVL
jgi:predicted O-methyltransferase YrrM